MKSEARFVQTGGKVVVKADSGKEGPNGVLSYKNCRRDEIVRRNKKDYKDESKLTTLDGDERVASNRCAQGGKRVGRGSIVTFGEGHLPMEIEGGAEVLGVLVQRWRKPQ